MALSKLKPPSSVPADLSRTIQAVYDHINSVIDAVNQNSDRTSPKDTEGKVGDIRLVKTGDGAYQLQGRFREGWASTSKESLQLLDRSGATVRSADIKDQTGAVIVRNVLEHPILDTSGFGGGGVAGFDTYVQYNSSGAFGATPSFTFDSLTRQLSIAQGTDFCHLLIGPEPSLTNGALKVWTGYDPSSPNIVLSNDFSAEFYISVDPDSNLLFVSSLPNAAIVFHADNSSSLVLLTDVSIGNYTKLDFLTGPDIGSGDERGWIKHVLVNDGPVETDMSFGISSDPAGGAIDMLVIRGQSLKIGISNSNSKFAYLDAQNCSSDRDFLFPNASGVIAISAGGTGGSGSAGAGKQYIQLNIGGSVYKLLHDGTV